MVALRGGGGRQVGAGVPGRSGHRAVAMQGDREQDYKTKAYDPTQVVLTSGDWVMLHSPEVTQKYIKSNFDFFLSSF